MKLFITCLIVAVFTVVNGSTLALARHDIKPQKVCIKLIMKFMQPDRSKAHVREIWMCTNKKKIYV